MVILILWTMNVCAPATNGSALGCKGVQCIYCWSFAPLGWCWYLQRGRISKVAFSCSGSFCCTREVRECLSLEFALEQYRFWDINLVFSKVIFMLSTRPWNRDRNSLLFQEKKNCSPNAAMACENVIVSCSLAPVCYRALLYCCPWVQESHSWCWWVKTGKWLCSCLWFLSHTCNLGIKNPTYLQDRTVW